MGLTRGTVVLAEGPAQAKVGKWGVGLGSGVLQVSGARGQAGQGRIGSPRSAWGLQPDPAALSVVGWQR